MAHPYNSDREDKVAKRRVSAIAGVSGGAPKSYASGGDCVKGYASGGAVLDEIATRAGGGKVKARSDRPSRAKGGRIKGSKAGKHKTNVNVIVAPSGGPQAGLGPKPPMPMPPPPAAPPALPPMAAKPPMPPMPAGPGAPGMGPPPPMPMRARGGKVSGADQKGVTGIGDRTPIQHSGNKSDTQNIGRKDVITKATGGPVEANKKMGPKFGGGGKGGKARLQKAHRQAGKGGLAQKNVSAAAKSGQTGL